MDWDLLGSQVDEGMRNHRTTETVPDQCQLGVGVKSSQTVILIHHLLADVQKRVVESSEKILNIYLSTYELYSHWSNIRRTL
jgi:hypothetical protein